MACWRIAWRGNDMLTAHLPSGYLLARVMPRSIPALMPAALIGAVLPDLDMIWFHLVDQGAVHHHRYWVHIPFFWAVVALFVLPVATRLRRFPTALVFFAAIFLHLMLDSIGGGILWGAPVSGHLFSLVEVPATRSHWILSFIFHWTFVAELMIWAAAIGLWLQRKRA